MYVCPWIKGSWGDFSIQCLAVTLDYSIGCRLVSYSLIFPFVAILAVERGYRVYTVLNCLFITRDRRAQGTRGRPGEDVVRQFCVRGERARGINGWLLFIAVKNDLWTFSWKQTNKMMEKVSGLLPLLISVTRLWPRPSCGSGYKRPCGFEERWPSLL